MTDVDYIERVAKMTLLELFAEVMAWPEYLTDPYYHHFARALHKRYEELTCAPQT